MSNYWDMYPLELDDPGANWCPVCGEMRGICRCDESDFMAEAADDWDDWSDEPREVELCEHCGGDGMIDDITPCPHCDGEGDKWWLR